MRKGQLIKKVLKAYKEHIKYIQENFQDSHMNRVSDYLYESNIHCGIVYTYIEAFQKTIMPVTMLSGLRSIVLQVKVTGELILHWFIPLKK